MSNLLENLEGRMLMTATPTRIFSETFESGGAGWTCGTGFYPAWEIATNGAYGPGSAFQGSKCAGTDWAIDGWPTDDHLISPAIDLPAIDPTQENLKVAFQQWYDYGVGNWGSAVMCRTWSDGWYGGWGPWGVVEAGTNNFSAEYRTGEFHSKHWGQSVLDLSVYAGQKVQIGFHTQGSGAPGWYVDNVEVWRYPVLQGLPQTSFENGWDMWSASNGEFTLGTPVSKVTLFDGNIVAGTGIDGQNPQGSGWLVSPAFTLDHVAQGTPLTLKYNEWHNYTGDSSAVYYQKWIGGIYGWGVWFQIPGAVVGGMNTSTRWTPRSVDVSSLLNEAGPLRIGFHHQGEGGLGLFLDNISIEGSTPKPGEIHGLKWNDLNANGIRENTEPTLSGWTIYLDNNQNGLLDAGETSTVTDASGSYAFLNLPAGTYRVAEVQKAGWTQTCPGTPAAGSVPSVVNLPAGGTALFSQGSTQVVRDQVAPGVYMLREMGPLHSVSAASMGGGAAASTTTGTFDIVLKMGPNLKANPAAAAAFEQGAAFLESLFSDPITVVIDAEIAPLEPGILGSSGSELYAFNYDEIRNRMVGDGAADESILGKLPTWSQFKAQVPSGFALSSQLMKMTRANLMALGLPASQLTSTRDSQYDAAVKRDMSITFNSGAAFDYTRADGIESNKTDFVGTVIHEICHGLGFISSTDDVDCSLGGLWDGKTVFPTSLDLFRLAPGAGATDFTNSPRIFMTGAVPNQVTFDGGVFNPAGINVAGLTRGDVPMSTGEHTGDSWQASHWKDNVLAGVQIGMMDPCSKGRGIQEEWTEVETRVMGLIGWDVKGAATVTGQHRIVVSDGQIVNDVNFASVQNPTRLPGDINGDNRVDFRDLAKVSQNYGKPAGATLAEGDLNGDGAVDFRDLALVAQNYNSVATPAVTTESPLTLALAPAPVQVEEAASPEPVAAVAIGQPVSTLSASAVRTAGFMGPVSTPVARPAAIFSTKKAARPSHVPAARTLATRPNLFNTARAIRRQADVLG